MTSFTAPEVIPAYGAPTISVAPEAEELLGSTIISGPMLWDVLSRAPIALDTIASLSINFAGNLYRTPTAAHPFHAASGSLWRPENVAATYDPSPSAKQIDVYVGNIAERDPKDLIHATDVSLRKALGVFVYRTNLENSVQEQGKPAQEGVSAQIDVIPNAIPNGQIPTAADELAYRQSELIISSPYIGISLMSAIVCCSAVATVMSYADRQRYYGMQLFAESKSLNRATRQFEEATKNTPIITAIPV